MSSVGTPKSAEQIQHDWDTKTDRLDSKVLARLPLLHPEGLHREDSLGPGDELKRAVKIRSGLVH
ncbi:MAG TPA: IS110 family transposase, partial [Mycobacterium sp.]|nr:IS110 family transposase [Mycobacterium sp.]